MKYNPEFHDRRSIRLRGYDYANTGAYFVTICCQNREHFFGKIVDGTMILNEYGEIAYNEWANTAKIRPNIKLYEFVIMPNHVHAIVEIKNVYKTICKLDVCDARMGVCNTPLRRQSTNVLQSPSNTIGAIIRGYKSAVTKQIRDRRGVLHTPYDTQHTPYDIQRMPHYPDEQSIWQRNYHEHIIRNKMEFARITEYIRNNPISWEKDRLNVRG